MSFTITVGRGDGSKNFLNDSDISVTLTFGLTSMPGCCGYNVLHSFNYGGHNYKGEDEFNRSCSFASERLMRTLYYKGVGKIKYEDEGLVLCTGRKINPDTNLVGYKVIRNYSEIFGTDIKATNFILTDAWHPEEPTEVYNSPFLGRTTRFYRDTLTKWKDNWQISATMVKNPNTERMVYTMMLHLNNEDALETSEYFKCG